MGVWYHNQEVDWNRNPHKTSPKAWPHSDSGQRQGHSLWRLWIRRKVRYPYCPRLNFSIEWLVGTGPDHYGLEGIGGLRKQAFEKVSPHCNCPQWQIDCLWWLGGQCLPRPLGIEYWYCFLDFLFDPSVVMKWNKLELSKTPTKVNIGSNLVGPSARYGHTACLFKGLRMFIYGGVGDANVYRDDLWYLYIDPTLEGNSNPLNSEGNYLQKVC